MGFLDWIHRTFFSDKRARTFHRYVKIIHRNNYVYVFKDNSGDDNDHWINNMTVKHGEVKTTVLKRWKNARSNYDTKYLVSPITRTATISISDYDYYLGGRTTNREKMRVVLHRK